MALESSVGLTSPEEEWEDLDHGEAFVCPDQVLDEFAEAPIETDTEAYVSGALASPEDYPTASSEQCEAGAATASEPDASGTTSGSEGGRAAVTTDNFDQLVTELTPRLLAYLITKLGNLEDAQDTLQEAFTKAYLAITGDSCRIPKYMHNVLPWFYKIAGNAAKDLRRKRALTRAIITSLDAARDEGSGEPLEDTLAYPVDGRDYADMIYTQTAVRKVLSWMPPHMRAHVLYDYDRTTAAERAAMVGSSPHAMKMQAMRARGLFMRAYLGYQEHGRVPNENYRVVKTAGATSLRYLTPTQRLGIATVRASSTQPKRPKRPRKSA